MDRPLNVHPDIWRLRNQTIVNKQQQKKIQLDQFTILLNSIDMIAQGIYNFKTNLKNIDLQQYSEKQCEVINFINDIVDSAYIPYTIDIAKKINQLQNKK